jgi:calcineurin-like phosphoesterase family protein
MKTFFTSDTHFHHNNVIGFCSRPYNSVEQMNESLIKNWNRVVRQEDHVWFLGDFSFGTYDQTVAVLNQLSGIKHLVVGNHDRKGRADKVFNRDWKTWFVDRHDYYRLKVDGHKLVLCHFPFAAWERGYINLHGHLHSARGYQNKYNQYDVGVDANDYTPVELSDAVEAAQAGVTSNSKY